MQIVEFLYLETDNNFKNYDNKYIKYLGKY
jgi:hypothetical protein